MAANTTKAEREARRVRALDLRLAGATYRAIAEANKVSLKVAYDDVRQALAEHCTEPANEVREMECSRLDRLLLAHWPAATKGDIDATKMVLSIMDRRARLLGLDAPKRIDIEAIIRRRAIEDGIDPDEAVAEARRIVAEAQA